MVNELDMIQNLADLLALDGLRTYSVEHLAQRFVAEQARNRHDPVIGNMTGVLQVMAKRDPQRVISNAELFSLYNRFARLNPETKFKEVFADLLPELGEKQKDAVIDRQPYNDVPRSMSEIKQEAIEVDEWETAFGQPVEAFGIKKFDKTALSNAFTHDANLVHAGADLVKTELEAIGLKDVRASVKYAVKSCILYLASFPTTRGKVHVNVPVAIDDNNQVQLPVLCADVTGNRTYALTADGIRNMLFDLDTIRDEMESRVAGSTRQNMTSDVRDITASTIEVDENDHVDPPSAKPSQICPELVDVETILENAVLQQASRYDEKVINAGHTAINRELSKCGFANARIRFAGDNPRGMSFDAALNTPKGKIEVTIPVEVVAGNALYPSQFVADDGNIHEFTADNLNTVISTAESAEPIKYTAGLVSMDYNSLRKTIHAAAFDHRHEVAQEALALVLDKFGADAHNACVVDYQAWMEEASQDFQTRCGSCTFYRAHGTRHATSTHDYCNLLQTKCANVVKKQGICVRAHLDWDQVRDDSYKGVIMTNQIKLT